MLSSFSMVIDNLLISFVLTSEQICGGFDDDLDIEPQRPILDIIEIVAGAFLDAGIAAHPIGLCPAGNTSLLLMTVDIARDALTKTLDPHWLLGARADDAHLTAQNIDELRQLVERVAAQKCTQRRD